MIDINLVPPQLRKQKKGKMLFGDFKIPMEIVIGIFGAVVCLLIFVHVVLFFINLNRVTTYKKLQSEWEKITPNEQAVDAILAQLRQLQGETKGIEGISIKKQINWAQKFNLMSDLLPKGVWLTSLDLNNNVFVITGSALSRQQKDMSSVHSFATSLKKDKDFMRSFADMELGSIQRRQLGTVEIMDFSIMFNLE